jgi:hypothetical protein
MKSMTPCKDCGSTTRKLSTPGPRCATCHRTVKAARKGASHELYVLKTYGLKAGEYQALYEAQGGVCFICERATGKVRKLAVDHDHKTGYVRGLLCKPCNSVLAHLRDDRDAVIRIHNYLSYPPAHDAVGLRKPDDA